LNAKRRSISAKSAQSVRSSGSKIVDTSVLGASQSFKKRNSNKYNKIRSSSNDKNFVKFENGNS